MELWKVIPKTNGRYAVSDFGRIWSVNIGVMKTPPMKSGYPHVNIKHEDGRFRRWLVHRLVAAAFIKNPKKLPEVNHRFGKRWDNRVTELEWVTREGNIQHAFKVLGKKNSRQPKRQKAVTAIFIKTKTPTSFGGIRECAETLSVPYQAIQRILKGNRKTYKGYSFEYTKS